MISYRYLLFDADNTLFDFDAAEAQALTQLLLHYGLPDTPEVRNTYLTINRSLWAASDRGEITQEELVLERFCRLFDALSISGDSREWNQFYLTALSRCPHLLPGAQRLCQALARRYTLALVTNGVPFVQRRRLEDSPLLSLFEGRIFISGEMGCRKPEKRFYDIVLSALHAQGREREVLAIGDSLSSDILGACTAGLDSVWLHAGTPPPSIQPTFQVETLSQLEQLLLS